MNKECIFCDIVDKKIDSYVVYENKLLLAMLDILLMIQRVKFVIL